MWRRSSCELHNDNDAVICIACYHLRFGRDANVLYDHIIRLKKIIKAQEAQLQACSDYKCDTKAEIEPLTSLIDQQRCDLLCQNMFQNLDEPMEATNTIITNKNTDDSPSHSPISPLSPLPPNGNSDKKTQEKQFSITRTYVMDECDTKEDAD
eukprot:177180_1